MAIESFQLSSNTPDYLMATKLFQSPQKAWGEGHEMAIRIREGTKKGTKKVIARACTLLTIENF
jgi:hypothetical protein